MKVLVLGGCGIQGRAALYDLSRNPAVDRVICADIQPERLDSFDFIDKANIRAVRIDATDQPHSYAIYWNLKVLVIDNRGRKVPGAPVIIRDKNGKELLNRPTNDQGYISEELPEYTLDGKLTTELSPYTVRVYNQQKEVFLTSNQEIHMSLK